MRSIINSSNKIPGLLLHRVTRLGDQADTQIFSFLVPSQLTRGFLQSVQSKEFSYGGQKWIIRLDYNTDSNEVGLMKDEKASLMHYRNQPLGFRIQWCSFATGMDCHLETLKLTIPHKENYFNNLSKELKRLNFTATNNIQKLTNWIEPGYLTEGKYLFDDWTCLIEIEFQNMVTNLKEQLRIPRDSKEAMRCKSLETMTFSYALADWSLHLDLNVGNNRKQDKRDLRPYVYLQRHSTSKHWTQLKFSVSVCWHDCGIASIGPLEQLISPESGATTKPVAIGDGKWLAGVASSGLSTKHRITVCLNLLTVSQISRVDLIPTAPQGGKNCARFQDPQGFDWLIMSDILGTLVRLKLSPAPDCNGPNFVQDGELPHQSAISTCWTIQLIPYDGSLNIIKPMSPFYITQIPFSSKNENTNEFQEVILPLDVEKVCSPDFGFTRPTDGAITLRVEWLNSYVLHRFDYQMFDDLVAVQRYHLIRDLNIRNAEIKQLIKNQKYSLKSKQNFSIEFPEHAVVSQELVSCSPDINTCVSDQDSKLNQNRWNEKFRKSTCSSISARASPIPSKQVSVHLLTPPVFINGTPTQLTSENGSNKASNCRRHSSCLENVMSSKPRHRRRLPSPPSMYLVPPRYLEPAKHIDEQDRRPSDSWLTLQNANSRPDM